MLIHYILTSLERGGAEFSIPAIVDVFRNLGHDVHVYVCEPRDRMAEPRLVEAGIPYTMLSDKQATKLGGILRYGQIALKARPDIIWASLSHATIVAQIVGRTLGIPVVSWKHSAEAKRYIRWSQRLSSLWVADSQDVAAYLAKDMRVAPDRIATWPLFCPGRAQPPIERWDGKQVLRIGSAGRLHPQKNYDVLIRAIAHLRHVDRQALSRIAVSIAGDGPQHDELRGLVASLELQDSITLLGWVEDVPAYLRSLHLYVQPSAYEGMCIAAHEAMALGLPIIATPVGEMRRSVRTGATGVSIAGDPVQAIAAAIAHFVHHPDQLACCGDSARDYVQRTMGAEAFASAGESALAKAAALVAMRKRTRSRS